MHVHLRSPDAHRGPPRMPRRVACVSQASRTPQVRIRPKYETSGSVYGRIKMPPMHRVLRAARRASRPGFGAACVWCGHAYRLGEYSPEAQDAHLLACPSYPEDGKQQIQQMQERRAAAKRTSR
jgi:hypothetical protein